MNRTTGKTHTECFVEFPTFTEGDKAVTTMPRGVLKDRLVTAHRSTQAELKSALFPHWSSSGLYLLKDEIKAILLNCHNHKVFCIPEAAVKNGNTHPVQINRRCPERPFKNVISILCKIPWHNPDSIQISHRDEVFEMLKCEIIEIVK